MQAKTQKRKKVILLKVGTELNSEINGYILIKESKIRKFEFFFIEPHGVLSIDTLGDMLIIREMKKRENEKQSLEISFSDQNLGTMSGAYDTIVSEENIKKINEIKVAELIGKILYTIKTYYENKYNERGDDDIKIILKIIEGMMIDLTPNRIQGIKVTEVEEDDLELLNL